MPYIDPNDRERLDLECTQPGELPQPKTPGELNYIISLFARTYFKTRGANYQAINDVVGALEGAKLEFVRRVVNPYEDQKIKQNGDLY